MSTRCGPCRARSSRTAIPIMRGPATTAVLATPETLAIMALRLGAGAGRGDPAAYGETRRIGEVEVTLHPAGHVLGSAQVLIAHRGFRLVVSGDYKRAADPDLRAVRTRALRRLRHRGDLWPSRVPASARRRRSHETAGAPPPLSGKRASRRGLFARQGAAHDRAAARGRLRAPDLSARRGRAHDRALSRAWRRRSARRRRF